MTIQTTPFAAFEKFAAFAKAPTTVNAEAVSAFYQKNFETLVQANAVLTEGARVAAGRGTEIQKEAATEASVALRSAFGVKTPSDVVANQADLVKRGIERATTSARELAEIVTKAQAEALDLIAKRVAANLDEVAGAAKQAITETKAAATVGFDKVVGAGGKRTVGAAA
jgi:phasin family protein